ncbi:hypothetical protein [Micromonospora sp. NBRC 101691]|uniref:hypothetical protein n=1 Tax=Micromonospora sp. NBRC 101691 TaxID=3032198 RepID=UPI0024A2486D|nr:hypothetical protein [Micromonospora sp. NBRC 101691]GLY21672.1 hypothetical protein Misp04_14040 [Micromonospora sp. NBRC 101691]
MNHTEAQGLIKLCTKAYRQPADADDEVLWLATLGDLPFGLARAAVVEWVRTSPYWPRPADIRERARLIDAQQKREAAKRKQLDDRARHAITAATTTPAAAARTGANMVRHILGRLADAGQDVANGKRLGKERAKTVAEAAVEEWLDRTADQPAAPEPYTGPATACPNCYTPHDQPAGTWCTTCAADREPTHQPA